MREKTHKDLIRILIAEDEKVIAADLRERVLAMGHQVVDIVSSGELAVEKALGALPNLVLMDIKLEGDIDGVTAAERIRSQADIPVVFATTHADPETLQRAKVVEPYGYIIKPFKDLELQTTIELALHRHESEKNQKAGKELIKSRSSEETPKEDQEALENLSKSERKAYKLLQSLSPFNLLPESSLLSVVPQCVFTEFAANELVAFEGDEKVSGFVVHNGRLGMFKSSPNGKEFIVELIPPGDPFGLIAAIDKNPYPATLRAQVTSTVMSIPRAFILQALDLFPELGKAIIDEVFLRLRSSHNTSRALAHDRVEVRVAATLCALLPRLSVSARSTDSAGVEEVIPVFMTRQELANLTGSTPETVIRATKAMERDGLLDLSESKTIYVLDKERLAAIVEEI